MPMSLFAAHPYTLCGLIVAVFYDHAVYYEAPPSVKRFGLGLCCNGRDTSLPQSVRWKPVFPTTLHLQNRLTSSSASDTEVPDNFEVIDGIN